MRFWNGQFRLLMAVI